MSPTPDHHPTTGLSRRVAGLARTIGWWERCLSVAVIPLCIWLVPKTIGWVGTVEERLHTQAAEIKERVRIDEGLEKLLVDVKLEIRGLCEAVSEQRVEVVQRLARIEAMVRK